MKQSHYKYYSQHGEDYLLSSFFDYKKSGFYIDVGAFDGVHLSNTYFFEQQGWTGICIEPHPEFFPLLQASRPKSRCLNLACVGDETVPVVEFHLEDIGLLSGIQGGEERVEELQQRYKSRGLPFQGFRKIDVEALTLNAICKKYLPEECEIDVVSIDVEGTEIEVLKGFDLERYQPKVLIIETNRAFEKAAITHYLVDQKGYYEARTVECNTFYVRDRFDVQKLQQIKIDCVLVKNIHPKGEKFTLEAFRDDHIIMETEFSDILTALQKIREHKLDSGHVNAVLERVVLYLSQSEISKRKKDEIIQRKDEIIQRKDERIQNIIQRKDERIQNIIQRKDEIIQRKDEQIQNIIQRKDEQIQNIIQRKDEQIRQIVNSYSYRVGKIVLSPVVAAKRYFGKLCKFLKV